MHNVHFLLMMFLSVYAVSPWKIIQDPQKNQNRPSKQWLIRTSCTNTIQLPSLVMMCPVVFVLSCWQTYAHTTPCVWGLTVRKNISVFSRLQNCPTVNDVFFSSDSSLFHDDGPAADRLRGPKSTVLVLGVTKSPN